MRLHDGETEVDAGIVRRLLAEQFPELAGLDVREARSTGTVNRIFRIGGELYARLPRTGEWAADLDGEARLVAELAPRLPLRIPEPVAMGSPASPTRSAGRSTGGSTVSRTPMRSWLTSGRRPRTWPGS